MDIRALSLHHLRYAVAVDRYKSFSKAAEACSVVQSTLSAAIKQLEDQLGFALFERNRKHVLTTPNGHLFLQHAHRIITQTEELTRHMEELHQGVPASISIGVIPTIAPFLQASLLKQVFQASPCLISFVELQTAEILAQVQQGQLDMGLIAFPYPTESLATEDFVEDPFYLVVPRGHPLTRQTTALTPQEIAAQPSILLSDGHCLRQHALDACSFRDQRHHQGATVSSIHTAIQLVAAGQGVFLLPQLALPALQHIPQVVALPLPRIPARRLGSITRPTSPYAGLYQKLAKQLLTGEAANSPLQPVEEQIL